jgi:ribosomal protein S18 acetylase RimI-like enzyme
MIKAKLEDKNEIISLLTDAFNDNLSINYIVKQDKYKLKRIRALMDYSFDMCFLFGDIYFSENHSACGLILFPQRKKTTLTTIWLNIKLIFTAITLRRVFKAIKREGRIKEIQPDQNLVYLWFIGVNPLEQHKGHGSRLLQDILKMANDLNLPTFLETSNLKNLPWYERMGFNIYNKLDLGYELFFFKKDPDNI